MNPVNPAARIPLDRFRRTREIASPSSHQHALRRHDLPAIKHSARRTLATMGLVLLTSANTGLRGEPCAAPEISFSAEEAR
jgi:hypothetical protein